MEGAANTLNNAGYTNKANVVSNVGHNTVDAGVDALRDGRNP